MSALLHGFLDNDSFFGKFMTKAGIIIGANLMFIVFSIPFFTIGAGIAALYHVMLKTLRGDGVLNPFKEFWSGFKGNFRQGTISWLAFAAVMGVLYLDLRICREAGGVMELVSLGVWAIILAAVISFCFLMPVMAAFSDTIPHLIRNGWFFALRRPLRSLVILFFNVFPLVLTYSDIQNLPLYAFLWCMFGFGAIAMLGSTLLLRQFEEFLPKSESEDAEMYDPKADEKDILDALKKLDGL